MTDRAAELCRRMAEAICPHGSSPCGAANALRRQIEEKSLPILRPEIERLEKEKAELNNRLAAKDAEIDREINRTHEHTCRIVALENLLREAKAECERLREAAEAVLPLAQQTVAAQAGSEWVRTTEENGGPYPSDELERMRASIATLRDALQQGESHDG